MNGAIIGNPVEHSLSPNIYNYLFKHFNIKASYEKVLLEDISDFKNTVLKYDFCNITYPFKNEALNICSNGNSSFKTPNSFNTIVNKSGKLTGYNTDGEGFANSISKYCGAHSVLIIGAGSTALASAISLTKRGYLVCVVNRSSKNLLNFVDCLTYTFDDYNKLFVPDIVVNMTSVGLEDDNLPFEREISEILKTQPICIDLIYGKDTPFLKLGSELGCVTENGKSLLIHQAALSFEIFNQNTIAYTDIMNALEQFSL